MSLVAYNQKPNIFCNINKKDKNTLLICFDSKWHIFIYQRKILQIKLLSLLYITSKLDTITPDVFDWIRLNNIYIKEYILHIFDIYSRDMARELIFGKSIKDNINEFIIINCFPEKYLRNLIRKLKENNKEKIIKYLCLLHLMKCPFLNNIKFINPKEVINWTDQDLDYHIYKCFFTSRYFNNIYKYKYEIIMFFLSF